MANEQILIANKDAVRRFNKEVIEGGDESAFWELMDPAFINRSAPPGAPTGPEGMIHTFNQILRPGLPDLSVKIHDQVAEGDKVTTRKSLRGTHRGTLLNIAATNKSIVIDVIDIVRLRDGRYIEHWGINTLSNVIAQLRG